MFTLEWERFQTDATPGNIEAFEPSVPIADPGLVLVQFGVEEPRLPYRVDFDENSVAVRDEHGGRRFSVFYVGVEP